MITIIITILLIVCLVFIPYYTAIIADKYFDAKPLDEDKFWIWLSGFIQLITIILTLLTVILIVEITVRFAQFLTPYLQEFINWMNNQRNL